MPSRDCIRCERSLPAEAFSPHSRGRDGLNGACKSCEAERIQLRKHGLTAQDRELTIATIGGCAICGRTEPSKRGWVIDHDHDCCPGDTSCASCRRGVLCHWCNGALGYAFDNPTILRRLADYLELGTRIPELSESDPQSESEADIRNRVPRDVRDERTEIGLTVVNQETAVDVCARIEDSTSIPSSGVTA
jgi:hypothetical protein